MSNITISNENRNDVSVFDAQQLETIKGMYCKGLTDDEITVFMHICQRTKLDPFAKQIYAVPRWDSKAGKNVMSVQTGIDGYRLIAERTGKYAPGKEPTFQYDKDGNLKSGTAYVKKMTQDGTWHEVAATAFFNEYCQRTKEGKPSQFWFKMGHTMIAKCAEALALRKAFPGDLSGLYTEDEMKQAEMANEPENLSPSTVEVSNISNKNPVQAIPTKINHQISQEKELQKISSDQLKSLVDLKIKCDPEYIERVELRLKERSINGFDELKTDLYELIMAGMVANSRKFQGLKNV